MNLKKIFKPLALLAFAISIPQLALGSVACTDPTSTTEFDDYVDCGHFVAQYPDNNIGDQTIYGHDYKELFKVEWDSFGDMSTSGSDVDPWLPDHIPTGMYYTDIDNKEVYGNNGTWTAPYEVLYMVIKAGTEQTKNGIVTKTGGYVIYDLGEKDNVVNGVAVGDLSGADAGFWATAPLLLDGTLLDGKEISHISFYGRAIPEPSTLLLGMIGLLGFTYTRRRQKNN